MQWIKASERLPPVGVKVIIREDGKAYEDIAITGWDARVASYEWLDETASPAPVSSLQAVANEMFAGSRPLGDKENKSLNDAFAKSISDKTTSLQAVEGEEESDEGKRYEAVHIDKELPQQDGFYYVIFEGGEQGNDWFKKGKWFTESDKKQYMQVQFWLKEISASQPPAQVDAVEFAEWIIKNATELPDETDSPMVWTVDRANKTTAELYQLFLQSKQKQ